MLTIGIIGKTNVGKTTLFNAATLLNAKISNYPFTTREPNVGIAYVCDLCVCTELGVNDDPLNSTCIDGWRYVPIRIIDVPGLVRDAWKGRGLGNRFLSVIGQADALIHVVDASGSIDAEGNITQLGSGNPVLDAIDVETEINRWIADIIARNEQLILREASFSSLVTALTTVLSGIKANSFQVLQALRMSKLDALPFHEWNPDQILQFATNLLPLVKPTLIIANKMDLATSEENLDLLTEYYGRSLVAACSAEAELVLRRAEKRGLLQYTPGQETFKIKENVSLTSEQRRAIGYIEQRVMTRWLQTGVQHALNTVIFKLLKTNMIYPVSDESKYSDNHGNILPDVHLLSEGSTPLDLAKRVHTRLAENYLLAIDAKSGQRLSRDYALRHKDVIKIMVHTRSKKRG